MNTGRMLFRSPSRVPAISNRPWLPGLGRIVRQLHGLPPVLARLGSLELRLATTKKEIRKAQRLRWEIFIRQGNATADFRSHVQRREICPFDRFCDHLIVVDYEACGKRGQVKPQVVGTYRLLRQDIAESQSGFYSASEFDIASLIVRHPGKKFLELGRSCILPEYRARRVLELLWRGLWIYARHHQVDVMIGCASLQGTDTSCHRDVLAGIRDRALAQEEWQVAPLQGVNQSMHRLCNMQAAAGPTAPKNAVPKNTMPPLVKGYLRLGARFGEGVFVDHQFGTTDVLVILPVNQIDPRYVAYFSAPLETEQKLAA